MNGFKSTNRNAILYGWVYSVKYEIRYIIAYFEKLQLNIKVNKHKSRCKNEHLNKPKRKQANAI